MASNHKSFRRIIAWLFLVFAVAFSLVAIWRLYFGKVLPGTYSMPLILLGAAVVLFALDRKRPPDAT
jgi:hypothetical protein